jgi:AcrR family transcriptional regulator
MPRAFSEPEREVLRKRLVEAGKKLLNRVGVKGLTVDDAAREAGISKGSFYSFFPSKEDFVLSILESWETHYRTTFLRQVLALADRPREAFEYLFSEAFAILEKEPGLASLGFREVEYLMERLPPERIAEHQAADAKVMEENLGAWIEAGLLAPGDLPVLEGLFNSLFILAMHREDFPEGSFRPAVEFMAKAFALKLTEGRQGES